VPKKPKKKLCKNYIIVVDILSREVKKIIVGPREQGKDKIAITKIDSVFIELRNGLIKKFPPSDFEIFLVTGENLKALKKFYSKFIGWEKVKVEHQKCD